MSTIAQLWTKNARLMPSAPALIDASRGTARSFAALSGRVRCLAVSLSNMFAPYQRVAVLSGPGVEVIELYLACAASGSLLFPMDPRQSTARLTRTLLDADPVAIFYDSAYQGVIDELRPVVKARVWISWSQGHDSAYEELLSRAAGAAGDPVDGPARGCAMLPDAADLRHRPFAVWSTVDHAPRAAVHTQSSYAINVLNHVAAAGVDRTDVFLMLGEPFDVYSCAPLAYLAMGSPVVIGDVDARDVATVIGQEGVTSLFAPTTLLSELVATVEATSAELSSLRRIEYGGTPVDLEVLRDTQEVFATDFLRSWGTPELGLCAYLGPREHTAALAGISPQRLSSCGRSAFLSTVAVLDEDACPVPRDHATLGEICQRGRGGMAGYWKHDEGAAKLRGGWVPSGAVGSWDAEGYVYVAAGSHGDEHDVEPSLTGGAKQRSVGRRDDLPPRPVMSARLADRSVRRAAQRVGH